MHKRLHGKEDTIGSDSGYTGVDKREALQMKGRVLDRGEAVDEEPASAHYAERIK